MLNNDNEESRRLMERCIPKGKVVLNPIIDWEDDDVWEFLNDWVKVPHCSLYEEGFKRLGCIGCPISGERGMRRDFERYPKYRELYIMAFEKMIANHPGEIRAASGALIEQGGEKDCSNSGKNGAPSERYRQGAERVMAWWMKDLPADAKKGW